MLHHVDLGFELLEEREHTFDLHHEVSDLISEGTHLGIAEVGHVNLSRLCDPLDQLISVEVCDESQSSDDVRLGPGEFLHFI